MKILYISSGNHCDYQDDCLSIGLKELFGAGVVDVNKREHIYTSYPEDKAAQMYGRGMTVTRILEDYLVDRSEIEEKIEKKYFDLVIYGSFARCSLYFPLVVASYPKSRIFIIDGEDHTNFYKIPFDLGIPYFKRELTVSFPTVFPINFAIPTVKFSPVGIKKREISICDPRDTKSYIYQSEGDYYGGYKEAYLGVTTKKAGWDCMRHYEIMANGCLPLFLDIMECPDLIMTTFNKELCKNVLKDYYSKIPPSLIYEKYNGEAFSRFEMENTTLALAKKIVSIFNEIN